MKSEEIKKHEHPAVIKLQEKFPLAIISIEQFRGDTTILIEKEHLLEVMQFLRNEPSLHYDHLSSINAVDYLDLSRKERYGITYNLLSYKYNNRVAIKILLPEESPTIESMCSIWKTADWQEREIYDLLGIMFNNHPNLERIFLPDTYKGHPLRKDYPLKGYGERDKY
jgi:NADH-quinone oxidoreductase subunit C